MTKMLSASGGGAPLTRGSAPGPRWGLCPQTPVVGSCSALAMVSPTTDPFRRLYGCTYGFLSMSVLFRPPAVAVAYLYDLLLYLDTCTATAHIPGSHMFCHCIFLFNDFSQSNCLNLNFHWTDFRAVLLFRSAMAVV